MIILIFGCGGFGFFAFRDDGSVLATGCGAVRSGPGKVPSYRADVCGVLAAMRNLFAEHRAPGVDVYLYNKAGVDMVHALKHAGAPGDDSC